MFYGHTSKAWSLYSRSNTRSNDDAVTVKITYITITNMFNSELAELLLRFKGKDEILVGSWP